MCALLNMLPRLRQHPAADTYICWLVQLDIVQLTVEVNLSMPSVLVSWQCAPGMLHPLRK